MLVVNLNIITSISLRTLTFNLLLRLYIDKYYI